MDLLTTVRKEGSRGGRGDFKWSDVQSSTHRENYLGHSLMAPVGRWQKGKDLNWYAKGDTETKDGETDAERAVRERKEEIKRVKEAEQDALAKALGFEVAPRNPNMEALGDKREVDRLLKVAGEDNGGQANKGIGFDSFGGAGPKQEFGDDERIVGNAEKQDAQLGQALREYKRRHGEDEGTKRSKKIENVGEGQDRGQESTAEAEDTDRGPSVWMQTYEETSITAETLDEEDESTVEVDHLTGPKMEKVSVIAETRTIDEGDICDPVFMHSDGVLDECKALRER